jgi:hypothetical protein
LALRLYQSGASKPKYLAKVISDAKGIGVSVYHAKTEGLFRAAEALRVTLAKHEVPKSKMLMA